MYNDELDPVGDFLAYVIDFVESYTYFDRYKAMDPDKKEKYITKLVLLICFEKSPRLHFDIGMDSLRLMVRDILDKKVATIKDDES